VQHVTYDDVQVPAIGFGTWEVTGSSAYDSVRAAIEAGYRHVDTAQIYGNEEEVGRAIADSDVDRDDLFVTTKIWRRRAAAADVQSSHAESLGRLGLDHVDLLLIHWPTGPVPIEETVAAMDELRQDGQTRLIGVSNHTADEVRRAAKVAPLATNQVEYHVGLGQDAVLAAVRDHGMFLTAYSPLGHGTAIGDPTVEAIAAELGVSPAQVALRWLLQQDDVVVLPRSENPDHIQSNLDVEGFALDDDQVARLDALPKDRREVDPPFAPDWD